MDPTLPAVERFRRLVRRLGGAAAAARAIGCSRAYVDMIVKGSRRPGLRVVYAIEKASNGEIPMRDWMQDGEGEGE